MQFDALGLSAPILKAIKEQGYDTPSPIQAQAIPAILEGQDVMAAAQTGTGKTAGFTLPILEKLANGKRPKPNSVRALVLAPTRELAAQVSESVETYGKYLKLSSAVVFGGVKINPQMMKMRKGVDILVATPGRLIDLHSKNAVKLDDVEVLVLDEADRMLDMGFINDIRKIIDMMPKQRQNLLFSATFSQEIRQLAKGLVNDPAEISVSPPNAAARTVEQWVVPVDKAKKSQCLIRIIQDQNWFQVLIFCRTKHGANKLAYQLDKAGIKAAAIHGNKTQSARTRVLAEFKQGELQALVATDIAARGLDIDQLPHVVNYDLPHVAADYVHRIGRTGRAGSEGQAVSLVCAAEHKELLGIERLIRQVLPRRGVPGFTPKEKLPESPKNLKPIKPKKPKKPKKPSKAASAKTSAGQSEARAVQKAKETPNKRSDQNAEQKRGQRKSSASRRTPPKEDAKRGDRPNRKKGGQGRTDNKRAEQDGQKTTRPKNKSGSPRQDNGPKRQPRRRPARPQS